jgi:hypothetical protein
VLDIVRVVLDVGGILASALAAWLWYRASAMNVRRVDAEEVFDYHDYNRLVVAFNRASARNRTGAIASAVAALIVAVNLLLSQF